MKLELKHLSAYLPYRLKCYVDEYGIELIIGATNDDVITTEDSSSIDSIKPILRPLSDLTKEIEVDGKKFVPSKYDLYIRVLSNRGHINGMEYYETISKLFEWHFDVFGLIEKGLAIDANTLTPTK